MDYERNSWASHRRPVGDSRPPKGSPRVTHVPRVVRGLVRWSHELATGYSWAKRLSWTMSSWAINGRPIDAHWRRTGKPPVIHR